MTREIRIYDTTCREGGQSMEMGLTPQDMLSIMEALDRFGVPFIEGPWPVPEEEEDDETRGKASEFYQLIKDASFREKIVVFGSTMEKGVEAKDSKRLKALVNSGLKNFAIFGKTWKLHVNEVLKTTLKENLRMIEDSVRFLKKKGGLVFFDAEHFFDGYLDDSVYAVQVLAAAKAGGADVIILCDTNGGMLPQEVRNIIAEVLPELPENSWGVHMHDDGGFALANTYEAILLGATYPQVTVLGQSERCGMPSLTSLVMNLIHKMDLACQGISQTKGLKSLAEFVAEKCNIPVPAGAPAVGENAFAHKAGSHQAGMRLNPSLQEHLPPELVGAKRRYPISGEVGRKAIVEALKDLGMKVEADDPVLAKILRKVKDWDKQGFHIESAPGTFWLLALRQLPNYEPPFDVTVIKPMVTLVKEDGKWKHRSRAEIEVRINGESQPLRLWERGNEGPLAAMDNALKPALTQKFSFLKDVHLVDFKVRILRSKGKGTASPVRVAVTGQTPFGFEETAGMSENILLASAFALIDLYELAILKSKMQK